MPLPKDRISFLLEAYTSKNATAAQEQELMEWMLEAQDDAELKDFMQILWNKYQPETHFNNVDWNSMFENIMLEEKVHALEPAPKRIFRIRNAAAAVIILLLSAGAYFYFYKNNGSEIAKTEREPLFENNVAAPQLNKAILTLSDGSVILLDSAGNGALAIQGNVKVEKTADGQIVYKGNATEIKMNTITVPKGSRPLRLQLADGSSVWLNVASSITYPTAFTGATRKVQVTGEAYFEVAHNSTMPFIVEKNEVNIQVLGTHFNVNTYENEVAMRITLLEGSVRVQKGNAAGLLKPGQQAVIAPTDKEKIKVVGADLDEVMAWKNGIFNFEGAHLDEVMRQLERWYDIEVVYENGIPDIEFVGKMSKNMDLNDLLEILKKTKVQFKLADGRKLIVRN